MSSLFGLLNEVSHQVGIFGHLLHGNVLLSLQNQQLFLEINL